MYKTTSGFFLFLLTKLTAMCIYAFHYKESIGSISLTVSLHVVIPNTNSVGVLKWIYSLGFVCWAKHYDSDMFKWSSM